MASPRPLPTNLKVIRGTAKPHRLNEREPRPTKLDDLKPPPWLDRAEKKCWREVVPQLQQFGIATVLDVPALMAYCVCWVAWQRETGQIRQEGTVIKGCLGTDVESPRVRVGDKYFKQLLALWREFGMTPSSRTRIRSDKDAPDDDFEAWQKKRRMAREGV